MKSARNQPGLRLVGSTMDSSVTDNVQAPIRPESAPAVLRAGEARALRAVNSENRAAVTPDIDPTDPRWVLAARTYSQLDGAALSPSRREKIMKLAEQFGIRSFDANVIVALVQDRARRGGSLHDITGTLQMMPLKKGDGSLFLWRWVMALGSAVIATALLIQWVLAG